MATICKSFKVTLKAFFVVLAITGSLEMAHSQEQKKMNEPSKTKYVIKDITPIDTKLEVDGIFSILLDESGQIKVEGSVSVIQEGSFVHRGGRFSVMPKGASLTWVLGGVEIFLPKGAKVDKTFSIWLPGTTHEIKCRIVDLGIKGYIFEGDIDNPLKFKLIKGIGYVYQKGHGTVTTPDGKTRELGKK